LYDRLVAAEKLLVAADFRAFSTLRADRCGAVTPSFIPKP
jgi:hypothetical protein